MGQTLGVRIVVLTADPDRTLDDPESVASIVTDLGCRASLGRFDLGGLDEDDLARRPPTVVVVDAKDELERAMRCRRFLGTSEPLADVPTLLALTLPRISALDFSAGFDDFVLQPIVPAELYARLRQLDWKAAAFDSDEVIKIGELVIDVAGHEAKLRGRRLDFTHQELKLLMFLSRGRGRVYTRDQLLQKVWGYQYGGGTRTVDIHVRRVRAKLGPQTGSLIETVRSVGYKMRADS